MTTEIRPAHSPLGASGAERWMNCPGSVALLKELKLPESDEPEYRSMGTSAHALGHHCLTKELDAWECVGEKFEQHIADQDMTDAVQVWLDECRDIVAENPGGTVYNEFGIDAPDFHPSFYGTLDRGYVLGTKMWIRDYKHGEGIAVDVEWNPQVMYYAYGLLRHHPEVTEVSLGIVQPRGFHPDGPVREWPTSADTIRTWAETTLIGAMNRTEIDNDLDAGPWCRFCPAKLVCPLMVSLFGAAMTCDPKQVVALSDESIGRSYKYTAAVKSYLKAMEEETFRRLNTGSMIDGVKLVHKRADRVYKTALSEDEIEKTGVTCVQDLIHKKFGLEAWVEPAVKSPAQLEKLGSAAKAFVREYAYTPESGLTVALSYDKRIAVKVQPTDAIFGAAVANLEETNV